MLQFSVVKKLRNRLHVKVTGHHFTEAEAAYVEDTLFLNDAIVDVTFYTRSSQIAIKHTGDIDAVRDAVLGLRDLDLSEAPALNEYSPRLVNKKYREMMINRTALYLGKKAVLPAPIAAAWAWFDGIKFIGKAIKTLWQRKLTVEVLDGVAIGAALLQKDYPTASAVMYLLGIGDILEEWTHRKSVLNLAQSMSLNVDKVWVLVDDIEVSKPANEVVAGDQIIIRQGEVIPLDGVVIDGVVLVNESSMTGEPEAVRRDQDSSVYAGTVVEDGKAIVEVRSTSKTSRYEKIVNLIEESEQMKSGMEQQAYRMADKLVPISFIGAGLTYLLTRNVMKALSFVMVDFSCALKLSIPLAVLSAMQEASKRGITVKGGKFLEQIAQADMIVFDKTGTLTKAEPEFEQIIPFNGHDADEMLKLAACIEEHFPHSMAKAIVRAAKDHALPHKEMHSDVEYVVAHGIASKVGRYRVRIGSAHYIFDDEKTKIPADEQEKFNNLPNTSSHIYLAIGGTLAAVICIKDPVREEAKQVIADLHALGIKKVVMMTGDSKRNAQRVADELGIDEDKYIEALRKVKILPYERIEYIANFLYKISSKMSNFIYYQNMGISANEFYKNCIDEFHKHLEANENNKTENKNFSFNNILSKIFETLKENYKIDEKELSRINKNSDNISEKSSSIIRNIQDTIKNFNNFDIS